MSKRDDILSASVRMIAQHGVRGLRVNDVAVEAGAATSLIYYHFRDRDGLLAAALEHVNERALAVRRVPSGHADATVSRIVDQLIAEFVDDDDVIENARAWNELRASAVYEPALRASMAEVSAAWTADIADSVLRAQQAGHVSDGLDAAQAATQLAVMMEGLDGRWLTGELTTAAVRAALADAAVKLLVPTPSPLD